MEGGPKASRRAILRHGALASGALAGVVGLTSAAARVRSGNLLASSAPSRTTLTLRGSDWHMTSPGLRRGDLPKRGTSSALVRRVFEAEDHLRSLSDERALLDVKFALVPQHGLKTAAFAETAFAETAFAVAKRLSQLGFLARSND